MSKHINYLEAMERLGWLGGVGICPRNASIPILPLSFQHECISLDSVSQELDAAFEGRHPVKDNLQSR